MVIICELTFQVRDDLGPLGREGEGGRRLSEGRRRSIIFEEKCFFFII